MVDSFELREHPVESEGQNEWGIRRAGISLPPNADLLQLAFAGPGRDGLGESLVQLVHVAVGQIEVGLKLFQVAAMFRQGGQSLESHTTVRDLASRSEEEFLKSRKRLSDSGGARICHHIHTAFWIVAMEAKSDVCEIFELEERLQDLENDAGHRIDTWDGEAGNPLVQTVGDHDVEQLATLALIRAFLEF